MSAARTVADVCARDVATALRTTPLTEAARQLRERHVGCLVIVDETPAGRVPVGMLTDRDIVTAVVARDVSARMLCAGDVMSQDVATVGAGASLHEALLLMRRRGVRRVPVVAPGGQLVGLLATDDLVRLLAADLHALAEVTRGQRALEHERRP